MREKEMKELVGIFGKTEDFASTYPAIYHLSERCLRILFDVEGKEYSIWYWFKKESLEELLKKIDSLKSKKAPLSEDGEWYEITHDFGFSERLEISTNVYEDNPGFVLHFLGSCLSAKEPFCIVDLCFWKPDTFSQFEKDLRSLYEGMKNV